MKLITATSDATQQALQTYVNQWCTANHTPTQPVILHETPVLDSTRDAIDWLADHDDPTGFHAVRYRDEHSAPLGPSDRELAVNRELEELRGRLEQRNEPYWAHHADDATDGMVTCPHCHSTLNTAYCGTRKSWRNQCPVCHTDLRPQPVLDQYNQWNQEYLRLRDERDQLRYERRHPVSWLVLLDATGHGAANITPA